MPNSELKLHGLEDPRLAVHATSPLPAWLWSADGARVEWANPVGARVFGAASSARLASKIFSPADRHRRQVAQLAHRLSPTGAVRLERLRGFGAVLNSLVTCACARLEFADGSERVLIAACEPVGRAMPLTERLAQLVEDVDAPVAAFQADGTLVAASGSAAVFDLHHLTEAGLEDARQTALQEGLSQAPLGKAHVTLLRVGRDDNIGLFAAITPEVVPAVPDDPPQAAISDLLVDEFAGDGEMHTAGAPIVSEPAIEAAAPAPAISLSDASPRAPQPRRHALRFMWQMDADGRFSLGSDMFTRLIGVNIAAGFGRPWQEVADVFGLDPEGQVVKAIATRESWSGITLSWPADDGSRLPVELSGLPIHDQNRNFVGYRGFGVCRDLDGLTRLEGLRSQEFFNDPPSADMMSPEIGPAVAGTLSAAAPAPHVPDTTIDLIAPASSTAPLPDRAQPIDLETPVETPHEIPENVVPFPLADGRTPVLTPVENSAFNEIARQLSARLEGDTSTSDAAEPPAALESAEPIIAQAEPPTWLAEPEPPARADSKRDRALLDLLPTGVLIYRLDRLLYANHAFLARMGYPTLHALEQAGGVDALYVEPGVSSASSTSEAGTPVKISSPEAASKGAIEGRLHTIDWDNDSALALILSGVVAIEHPAPLPAAAELPAVEVPVFLVPEPAMPVATPSEPSAVGHANAEELAAILDTTADGILMFDAEGKINSCNRSAEALFGYDGEELVQRNLGQLFAPESESVVRNYLESISGDGVASLLEHGREVLGRINGGGLIPMSMTMGRTQAQGPNFFAVFRDLSQSRKSEGELREARRLAERTVDAKADLLARISHEIRTPLNAIIGFAEVMIGERFGALGNERYIEYMKDVRASGQRVVAVIDDLTNLSRIETGKLDLDFSNQDLNDMVESCVAVMQPQASRERIIIRTSLAQMLPPVIADGPALRQITMNLIGNSIHLANAGGQVIVSTTLTDFGEVALRIRDSGHGLNDNEVAAALEPFRAQASLDQSPEAAVSLSLTKALVEANRAQFNIKTGTRSGTLVEVVFSRAMAKT